MARRAFGTLIAAALVTACSVASRDPSDQPNELSEQSASVAPGIYYPPAGQGLDKQSRRTPAEVGLKASVIDALQGKAERWALWRHGYLVHVEGDFNQNVEISSLRKTWHAMAVGAAIKQGLIPSYNQRVNVFDKSLRGNDALATWRHLLTQSAGLDYPYGRFPDFLPGEMWTYSDLNIKVLCNALARVYGRSGYSDRYDLVLKAAYFDDIGMTGWSTSVQGDGVRMHLDLEDMGRLGLLALARGKWRGTERVPRYFVEELESKQTRGMRVNYDGPNDGSLPWTAAEFPEAPYGYLTWNNADRNFYKGADAAWAWGTGYGGNYILWNRNNGLVFAAHGKNEPNPPVTRGIPHILAENVIGPNPLSP